ncbi:MAG: RNA methyltransferase [Bacteroidales bacterium]|nr:RNA methyltransferase [Bacteroidales bacterium]
MISAAEIKMVSSLSQKKFRDGLGLFVVEGEKMVSEALSSAFTVRNVYRREDVGEKAMERMSSLSSPSPVLAVVEKPSDKEVELREGGLYLALDSIRDPGNLGTILRTADWFGVDGILASEDTVDIYNPKVVQATMGAVFRVAFQYVPLPETCLGAARCGARVFGTFLEGTDIRKASLGSGSPSPRIIVIGNEAAGISQAVAGAVTDRITIPRFREGQESLNAAVAAAITLSEFRRQQ